MRRLKNRSGVSIIAVVFLIVVVAFLGVIVVSLFVTQSSQSVGELHSTQALYIADGGIEYALKTGTFPNYSYPVWSARAGASATNPCPSGTGIALGQGEFCVDPPTVLSPTGINATALNIPVVSTSGFPSIGMIVIDQECIQYDSTTATSFVLNNVSGRGRPNCLSGSNSSHAVDAGVYPLTLLSTNINVADCNQLSSISVSYDVSKFKESGIIKIEDELMHYQSRSGTTFSTLTRCFKGTTAATHTPTKPIFQYVVTSTGSVSTIFGGTARRVVQVTVSQ